MGLGLTLCCSWNEVAKVELNTPLNKLKPLCHLPNASVGKVKARALSISPKLLSETGPLTKSFKLGTELV